jgi:hypothetical protein
MRSRGRSAGSLLLPCGRHTVSAGVVHALVMAAASIRSDTVYTSDLRDLERLLDVFPDVRLERVRACDGNVAAKPLLSSCNR